MISDKALLSGKKVVVIGGGGLLGAKICEALVKAGAMCTIADLSLENAEKVASQIEALGYQRPLVTEVSITNTESVERVIDFCAREMGGIDSIVNTAYPRNRNYGKKFELVDFTDFCENVNLHLGGYFLVSQKFLEYFKRCGGGCLLNMSSIYGVIAPRFEIYAGTSMTMPVEYAAIKSALIHLTKYMAKYYAGNNIRVNCVSLGGLWDNQPDSFRNGYRKHCLNKGMLEPTDIVGTIIFLLSDQARYINGQNIIVDDGFVL